MPVEIQYVIPEVFDLKESSLLHIRLKGRVSAIIICEAHLLTVLNDWVALCNQMKLGVD